MAVKELGHLLFTSRVGTRGNLPSVIQFLALNGTRANSGNKTMVTTDSSEWTKWSNWLKRRVGLSVNSGSINPDIQTKGLKLVMTLTNNCKFIIHGAFISTDFSIGADYGGI